MNNGDGDSNDHFKYLITNSVSIHVMKFACLF